MSLQGCIPSCWTKSSDLSHHDAPVTSLLCCIICSGIEWVLYDGAIPVIKITKRACNGHGGNEAISHDGDEYMATYWFNNINSSPPGQNGYHFTDNLFKLIFVNENVRISIWISLKFVPKGPIDNKSALVKVMAWCWTGGEPLPDQYCPSSLTDICSTRGRWVKWRWIYAHIFIHEYSEMKMNCYSHICVKQWNIDDFIKAYLFNPMQRIWIFQSIIIWYNQDLNKYYFEKITIDTICPQDKTRMGFLLVQSPIHFLHLPCFISKDK